MSFAQEKANLLDVVSSIQEKREKYKRMAEGYFTPDMTDNMDKYYAEVSTSGREILIRTAVKGLRYDNRTLHLEKIKGGDPIVIERDSNNIYNVNNFNVKSMEGESLGVLSAELCDSLAPLYDAQVLTIQNPTAFYIEKIGERSRYAQQGVLFIEMKIDLSI